MGASATLAPSAARRAPRVARQRGENRLGPNLSGILGKKAGTVPGYVYTDALKRQANC
jgi:cytochrome c2